MAAVASLVCLGSAALVGCGGGDDGPGATCGQVQPCGGDLVGRWNMVASCADRAALTSQYAMEAMTSWCPIQTLRNFSLSVSGSFVFNSDLTYSVSLVLGGVVDVNVPAACLAGSSCAALTASLQAAIAGGTAPGLVSASCAGSSDCVCHQVTSVPQSEAGSYTTTETVLNLVPTGGTAQPTNYCVKENTLHFMELAMGSATINYAHVGVKQ